LGFASAFIITAPVNKYKNATLSLVHPTVITLQDIAKIISEVKKIPFKVRIVSSEEAIKSQIAHSAPDIKSFGEVFFKYWNSLHQAVAAGEGIKEDDTVEKILSSKGRKLTDAREIIRQMLRQ
jgi:hypothetical protein